MIKIYFTVVTASGALWNGRQISSFMFWNARKKVVCCLCRSGRWAFPLLTWMMCTLTPSLRLVNFKFKDEFQCFFRLSAEASFSRSAGLMNNEFLCNFFRLNMRIPLLRMEFVLLVGMWIWDEPKMLNFIEVFFPRLRWSMQNILKMLKLTNIKSHCHIR